MKKTIALLLTLVLTLALFSACGGGTPSSPEDVTGKTHNTGKISVLAPNGWAAFSVSDTFDDYEGDNDPYKVQICKGASSEWDLFSKPYLQVTVYPKHDMTEPWSSFYDDVVDLDSFTTGKYTWTGFTATSFSTKIATVWTDAGDVQIEVNVWLSSSSGDSISLEDVDVQAILASIAY